MTIRTITQRVKHKKQSKRYFEKRLFKVLVSSFFLGGLVYIYSLGSVVFGVIERRNLEKEIASVSSEIGALEKDYLDKSSNISLETASMNGFVKAEKIFYESQEHVAINNTKNTEAGL